MKNKSNVADFTIHFSTVFILAILSAGMMFSVFYTIKSLVVPRHTQFNQEVRYMALERAALTIRGAYASQQADLHDINEDLKKANASLDTSIAILKKFNGES